MANMMSKTTLEYKISVNRTSEHPPNEWFIITDDIIESDKFSAYTILPESILDIPAKYRKVENDNVVEMNQAEKDVVDADVLSAQKVLQGNTIIEQKLREIGIERGMSEGLLNADGSAK
jgi:hypothetical protein